MNYLELKLIKKIADIEGIDVAMNLSKTYWLDKGRAIPNPDGDWSLGYEEYNPLTDKALLFDLMVKHKVEINHNEDDSNLAVIWPGDIETSMLIGNYFAEFKGIEDLPRAILECIVEANHE
ncbi:MAG: hypothetical protein JKY89_10885 [Immundisolibacteraceae bacterium]|nr:hypothetical protein [Immundisolibacteraceae bacterium]